MKKLLLICALFLVNSLRGMGGNEDQGALVVANGGEGSSRLEILNQKEALTAQLNETATLIAQTEQLVSGYEAKKNKQDMLLAQRLNKSRSNFKKKAVISVSAIVIGGAALYYFRPQIIDNTRGLYQKFFNIKCVPCARIPTYSQGYSAGYYSQGYSAGYSAGVSTVTSGIVGAARTLTSSHDYSTNALRKIAEYIHEKNPAISIARLFGLKE